MVSKETITRQGNQKEGFKSNYLSFLCSIKPAYPAHFNRESKHKQKQKQKEKNSNKKLASTVAGVLQEVLRSSEQSDIVRLQSNFHDSTRL